MGQQDYSQEPDHPPTYPPPTHLPRSTRSVHFDIGEHRSNYDRVESDVASVATGKKSPVYVTVCGSGSRLTTYPQSSTLELNNLSNLII